MDKESTPLSQSEHRKIFIEDVIPNSRLDVVTTQVRPKAAILGGQPGAGKGALADAAVKELNGNVVLVDPDAVREFHPDVDTFRQTRPYTWSGDTHADASRWADELLDATVAGKKNLIFDTTLSNVTGLQESYSQSCHAQNHKEITR